MRSRGGKGLLVLVLAACFALASASAALATTYYVDSVGGNDSWDGTSPSAAWQNLTKVNTVTFAPGDQILLKAGSVWNGQHLWPKGSGTDGNPIIVDTYDTGAEPLINCDFVHAGAVYLYNQEYWEISNLELTNWTTGDADDQNGVRVIGEDVGVLNHIHLKDLDIHDVNGALSSRSIRDKAKTTGGILFDALGSTRTSFNDVLIEGCYIHFVDRTGIKFWSNWSRYKGATWEPHTNVVIRSNVLDDIGGDGIVPCMTQAPLVEHNVASYCNNRANSPNVAMWGWDIEDAVFQCNEAYLTQTTEDGQGFDIDDYQYRTVIQYNYSHDNVGGFMLVCNSRFGFNTDSAIRYNISQHDHNKLFRWSGYDMTGHKVYNNTFYVAEGDADIILEHNGGSGADAQYLNNIFHITNPDAFYDLEGEAKTSVLFDYNVFYGVHPTGEPGNPGEPNDAHKIIDSPPGSLLPQLMVDPGSGGIGRDSVDGYKLAAGSPAIDSGMEVPGNGGLDYWGNSVPANGTTDRGAHEYGGGGPQPPVADFSGNPTSGNAPLTVLFTDLTSNNPTSWDWTFGDTGTDTVQNPSHDYTSAGSYTVSLTAYNSVGQDTETKNNYISVTEGQPPAADFVGSPTSGNAPLTVLFTDLTSNNPTSWDWTFGDTGTDTVQNPSHDYTSAGDYTVSLTAYNAYGQDTDTKVDYISVTAGQPPVAEFVGSPLSGNAPLDVDFTDQSTNSPTSWDWDFGDTGTDTAQNPSHTYTSAGDYTVSLTAYNAHGQDTETKTDYITASGGGGGDYFCTSATITDGTLASGDHTDTHASDDVYMVVTSVKVGGKQCTIIEYTFETGLGSASSMSVTSESKVSYVPPPDGQRERVYVYNYSTSDYDLLGDDWVLGTDTTNVTGVPSPSDYLSAGGQVKVEIRTGDRDNDVFDHSIDLVKITAAP